MRTLLSDPRYRAFWIGQATSVIGNGITLVALAALVIPHRGGQAFGLALAAESLTMGVLLLGAGVLVDRYSRTAVMAIADVARGIGVVGILLFAASGPLAGLLVACAFVGAGIALHQPAHRAAIPQLVRPDQLQAANALDSATMQLGLGAGTALGGVLVSVWGPRHAVLVDLATFAVSLLTLLWLRLPPVGERPEGTGLRHALHEAHEGIREVRRRPWVAVVMLQGTVQVFCLFAPAFALIPVVALARYGNGAYGWYTTCGFVGTAIGAALVARTRPQRPGWSAMNAVAPCALLPLLLVVDLPLWAFCLINAVAWAGIGWFAVLWFGALQTEFPAQVQGRVFSLESLATFGLQPLGLAIAPVVAAAVGLTTVAVVASLVMIVTTYAVFLVPGVARFRSPDLVPAQP
ncbi:MFS transporter [Angustibacter luteus]|uniref:MFS transporter n=1 Tax=Angustibacter luteus TaxID=658456 RepID=A0ABW1JEV2_9ACTN